MSLNFSRKSEQMVGVRRSLRAHSKLTFDNSHHLVRTITIAREVLLDLHAAFEFSAEKVTFIEEKD